MNQILIIVWTGKKPTSKIREIIICHDEKRAEQLKKEFGKKRFHVTIRKIRDIMVSPEI